MSPTPCPGKPLRQRIGPPRRQPARTCTSSPTVRPSPPGPTGHRWRQGRRGPARRSSRPPRPRRRRRAR
ncbi:hypothetical protein Ae717Ps2_6734 [Pseudonocardia sp. Ae717_Ps2]|nr:hypothetical protein Ae717Ps2_6734 [Pseudonocardia sp. Ae717_Ps2]